MSSKPPITPFTVGRLLTLHAAEDVAAERGLKRDANRLSDEAQDYFDRFVSHRPQGTVQAIEMLRLAFYISQRGNLEAYDSEAVGSPIRAALRCLESKEPISATQQVRFALHLALVPDSGERDPPPPGVDIDLITVLRHMLTYLDGWSFR